jgi:hypothetical protein
MPSIKYVIFLAIFTCIKGVYTLEVVVSPIDSSVCVRNVFTSCSLLLFCVLVASWFLCYILITPFLHFFILHVMFLFLIFRNFTPSEQKVLFGEKSKSNQLFPSPSSPRKLLKKITLLSKNLFRFVLFFCYRYVPHHIIRPLQNWAASSQSLLCDCQTWTRIVWRCCGSH